MGMTQQGKKCIFMLCMKVAEEDMEVQEETVLSECKFFFHLTNLNLESIVFQIF